jgi:hypothetical protein
LSPYQLQATIGSNQLESLKMKELASAAIVIAIFICEAAAAQPGMPGWPTLPHPAPPIEKPMSQAHIDRLYLHGCEFDGKQWRANAFTRIGIAPLLERSRRLLGMTRHDVHSLLGEPDSPRTGDKSDRETYSLITNACGRASRLYLELDYNLYDQLYCSRIMCFLNPVSQSPIHEVTPFRGKSLSSNLPPMAWGGSIAQKSCTSWLDRMEIRP